MSANGLHLYDTLTDDVRPFRTGGDQVTIYVCGVTPYDTTHLGHAFTFAAFDVLIRYLRYRGRQVRYVQNITDIDDPLFARAKELGVPYERLAEEQTVRYFEDMAALNILPAEANPRSSEEIPAMIRMIERLVDAEYAYVVDGHVYFRVASDHRYGELSKLDREEMIAVARDHGGNPDDPLRRDPLDFLLWRPAADGEPGAPSPWGQGLPGWHIECSAMSLGHLGAPIDLHGGGADLIFPHHESEIAQSEAAMGARPFVRHWMHTGLVALDGAKMSKSLGNMVFVRDLLQRYDADTIRLYLASHRYRAPLVYDETEVDEAAIAARELRSAAGEPSPESDLGLDPAPYRERFERHMDGDLDTPGALDALRDLADEIQGAREEGIATTEAQETLRTLARVLGLRLAPLPDRP